jgi:flagellar motor protein MotB
MSRILIGLMAGAAAMSSVGCAVVDEAKYTREIEALKDANNQLSARNNELEPIAEAYEKLSRESIFSKSENEMFAEIARELSEALKGFKNSDGSESWTIDRNGKVTFATDVLFESGSWTITPKGMELLKKFSATVKNQTVKFRVIGHTDNTKIAKEKTKQGLDTDTNMELSTKRAVAVMGALMKNGIVDSRFVEVIGMGSSRPAATQAKSRRVEVYLVKDDVKKSSAQK